MRTVIEVVARRGSRGETRLPVIRATGQLAVRRTGEHRIHLVATAFGPLGGDVVDVGLLVEAGARLEVCSAAAAVCLPSRDAAPSRMELHAEVAAAARLDVLLEPTVVAVGAEHHTRTDIGLAGDARLRVTEQVVLGRHAEAPGRWAGTTRIESEGRPVLHTSVELGPGSAMWRPPTTPRAYATDLVLGANALADSGARSRTGPSSLLLPLPRGWVSTAWGDRHKDVLSAILELWPENGDQTVVTAP